MSTDQLPADFQDLEQFLPWSLNTERERNRKRLASTMPEIQAFYDVMLARVEAALEYLNEFPLNDMPVAEKNLMNLTLMLAESANAVELFKTEPGVIDGFESERFIAMHAGGEV
ncbi:MAG: hypothetical protein KUG81_05055 [Gammaproteobacteria bacterium]|nr:hypothetical protein [Gammaproteobacteria bacterium]